MQNYESIQHYFYFTLLPGNPGNGWTNLDGTFTGRELKLQGVTEATYFIEK